MPVLMTKTYMCSEQLLAPQEPWVVRWRLVYYHPFVAEEDLTAGADHMALKTHACPKSPSVGCSQASSCPYVLLGACCSQSLSFFTVLFLCLRGHKMLLPKKPLDWLHPSWPVCTVAASRHSTVRPPLFKGQKYSKWHVAM